MRKIIIIGSGALKIGEAGEFDYSGTQALKALKEEGYKSILINPNIATVQTSEELVYSIYLFPINPEFVEKIIYKEKPYGILLSFGGQTALNCGIELFRRGVLKKYNIEVLGTSLEAIIASEDRYFFCKKLNYLNIKTARSKAITSLPEAFQISQIIGFPIILRSAYALGGLGSGVANNKFELKALVEKVLTNVSRVLLEEYLKGWKEIEYEVIRDSYNNCITVCNMENFDPIGVHTGDSIVVAPSQTLSDIEYQNLRRLSIIIARYFNIIGECNVQFALSSRYQDYRVIEINARLSRSSALASKATGYPVALLAAKLALGYGLHELKNVINNTTYAFFEPALDYIVCKIPRWDFKKFSVVSTTLGSSMKSVGEVMSIGGSFEEALQKGLRMLDIGLEGFINTNIFLSKNSLKKRLSIPTDLRIEAIEVALEKKYSVEYISEHTGIDPWFIYKLLNIYDTKEKLSFYKNTKDLPSELLSLAKKQGFSDLQIASILKKDNLAQVALEIRKERKSRGIIPHIRKIDTLAAEFTADTNYLYLSYCSSKHDLDDHSSDKSIVVLGSGGYCIGSSVEFDWCCINALKTLRQSGYRSVMINCNPETVSTDFDECDNLYFEELSLERVLDITEFECPEGIIISMGGQTPNSLAIKLYEMGQTLLGTSAQSIDRVEDRYKFSKELNALGIKQPLWKELSDLPSIYDFLDEVGYPVIIRPSYVLSGSAMNMAYNIVELESSLKEAMRLKHTVLITEFIENAKEVEFDAIASKGEIIYYAISEHIEYAGVHSGDATLVYPPQNILVSTLKKLEHTARKIAKYFYISGPFNIQFLLKKNFVLVIECNLRASRSLTFVSKVSSFNMIKCATEVLLENFDKNKKIRTLSHVGVKASQFSFSRLQGADPVLSVNMTSTGEVGCLGNNLYEALIKAMLAVGYRIPEKNILISVGEIEYDLLEACKSLINKGYVIFAIEGHNNLPLKSFKADKNQNSNVIDYILEKKIDLIINIPKKCTISKLDLNTDYNIRRAAIDFNIPLITNARLASIFIRAFCNINMHDLYIIDLKNYF